MIHKSELVGKYIAYIDKHSKHRIAKVIKVTGNTTTVRKADRVKERVYKDRIIGRQFRKRGVEEIDWSRAR